MGCALGGGLVCVCELNYPEVCVFRVKYQESSGGILEGRDKLQVVFESNVAKR